MERYTLLAPDHLTTDDHAGRIEAWLQSQGLATAGVSIRWTDTGRAFLTVRADRDPTDALAAYVPTLTTEEQARETVLADAAAAVAAIRGKPRSNRTATETVLLALALDEPVLTPSTPEEPIDDVEPVAPAEVEDE